MRTLSLVFLAGFVTFLGWPKTAPRGAFPSKPYAVVGALGPGLDLLLGDGGGDGVGPCSPPRAGSAQST